MEEDGFTLVTNKKRKLKKAKFIPHKGYSPHDLAAGFSKEELKASVEKCYQELMNSPFIQEIDLIVDKLKELNPKSIVCYALGKIDNLYCQAPKYQLAMLLHIKYRLKIEKALVFDPVLTEVELNAIQGFKIERILVNEEGRRLVEERTLFIIFHGEKFLFENLINTNRFCKQNIIILGNDLKHVLENQLSAGINSVQILNSFYRETIFDSCVLQWF
ncbi:SRR1-like protein isoform X1 [Oopsacas minuta]|uniref:SRR1-like protein isoform X1 n=1 Tax=Oopsacas minuta TaxID=111878 RepID=A0AAV7JKG0_9METZ|nr:SRR1-like protein isoform X1 [Oopsacas minuta]